MTAITFDTLAHAKKMKAVGFTEQQAEAQAQAIAEVIDENLATKKDIAELRTELKRDIKELEYKLTIRMGGMIGGAIAILGYLIKFGH